MADIFTPEKRSWIMSRIRAQNTKIDLKMKTMLNEMGCKFKMYPKMYGNPDFIVEESVVIFCDGDFWHGYKYFEKKRLRKKFWRDKIETNMKRDRRISRKLRHEGYSVLRFWEHDIHKKSEVCERKIERKISEILIDN